MLLEALMGAHVKLVDTDPSEVRRDSGPNHLKTFCCFLITKELPSGPSQAISCFVMKL